MHSALLAVALGSGAQAQSQPAQAPQPMELGRSGTVLVEQAGRVVGLGIVLNEDGRVLTSAARLKPASAGQILVRYSDGSTVPARIGHSDKDRDLALLVPKTVRVRHGIQASRMPATAVDSTLSSFAVGVNRNVTQVRYTLKSLARSGGRSVLELTPTPKAADLGSPLLDSKGQAVALLVSGCLPPPGPNPVSGTALSAAPKNAAPSAPSAPSDGAASTPAEKAQNPAAAPADASPRLLPTPGTPCVFVPVGLPVAEARQFLKTLPPDAAVTPPWLGIDGISADTGTARGLRIGHVEPKSPAAGLGLQVNTETSPGDVLVAVAGKPVPTPEALSQALSAHAPGERVELLIFGQNGYRTLSVRLAERPAGAPTPLVP